MRVDRHAGIPPSWLTTKRVNHQWRLNPPIGNNREGSRVASDLSNLLQKVARSKAKVTDRWAWSGRSCQKSDGSFRKSAVWELRKNAFRPATQEPLL